MDADERCTADLRHAHGFTRCELPAGHEGKHQGECEDCRWNDWEATLTWTEHHARPQL
jgi:hypothetical protein